MTTKKLAQAQQRLVLALDAAAPQPTIALLRRRVVEAGGDPDSVISESQGDVTVPPSNPLPTPLTEQDKAIISMVSELRRRRQKVAELKAEQRQVEADLLEIQEELDAAERELDKFVQRESRRGHNSEPLDAA